MYRSGNNFFSKQFELFLCIGVPNLVSKFGSSYSKNGTQTLFNAALTTCRPPLVGKVHCRGGELRPGSLSREGKGTGSLYIKFTYVNNQA